MASAHSPAPSGLFGRLSKLWGLAFGWWGYANLTLAVCASMTVIAQVGLTQLPIYIGRVTSEMTGGSNEGMQANKETLRYNLCMAFSESRPT